MENKKITSFIPYQDHHIINGYSVASSFTEKPGLNDIGEKYENYLNGLVDGKAVPNQHAIGKAMGNLQIYIAQERKAEIAFLNEVGGLLNVHIDNNEATWKTLIESFNKVLGAEEILNRNVAQLKKLYSKNGKGKKSEDVTRHLRDTYLPKAIKEFLPIKSVNQLTDDFVYRIMKKAVELMFTSTDKISDEEDAESVQCYKEIWDALNQLSHTADFFKNLANIFNLKDFLIENINKIDKNTSYKKYNIKATQKNNPGEILEIVEATALNQLAQTRQIGISSESIKMTMDFIATGNTKQKTDTFGMVMAEGSIDFSNIMTGGSEKKDNSYRLRSLERIETLLEKIGNKKAQLIFISDKNYLIGKGTRHSEHGGFTAETPTLSSLSNYGAKFHIPNINGMIEYLASAGPGMIVEDVDMCLEVIKICIGNFLFDDLQITGPKDSGANRVHMLNLGSTYLPASVFLEATLQGLLGIGNLSADEMVQVKFNPHDGEPGPSTLKGWNSYHKERLKSEIEVNFLAGYTKFMSTIFGE